MTLGQLIEEVLENLHGAPGAEQIQRAEVVRKLNLAQREIALELELPRLYITIPSGGGYQVGAFSLPVEVQPEGLKSVKLVEASSGTSAGVTSLRDYPLPIFSVREANLFYPKWEATDSDYTGPPFVLYDPFNPEMGIQPVGISSAIYAVEAAVVPEGMSALTDQPFAINDPVTGTRQPGIVPTYHRLLSFYVTYEFMLRLGDERRREHYGKFNSMKQELFNHGPAISGYLPTWGGNNYA